MSSPKPKREIQGRRFLSQSNSKPCLQMVEMNGNEKDSVLLRTMTMQLSDHKSLHLSHMS